MAIFSAIALPLPSPAGLASSLELLFFSPVVKQSESECFVSGMAGMFVCADGWLLNPYL